MIFFNLKKSAPKLCAKLTEACCTVYAFVYKYVYDAHPYTLSIDLILICPSILYLTIFLYMYKIP
jgi:hypothetical protein